VVSFEDIDFVGGKLMMISRRFGRVQSLAAVVALALGLVAGPVQAGTAAPDAQKPEVAAKGMQAKVGKPKAAGTDTQRRGDPVSIQTDHWDGTFADLSPLSSSQNTKFSFGNRITIPAEVTPFTLQGVIVVGLEYTASGTPVGLQVGDPIEILIFADASASGDQGAGKLIYRQTDVFKTFNPDAPSLNDVLYSLTSPVTVNQGDLYIFVADRTTDTGDNTGTVMPYLAVEDGGTNFSRSLMAGADDALNLNAYNTIDDTFGGDPLQGEFIVRAVGSVAAPGTPVTNMLEPTDGSLSSPTNLTGTNVGAGGTLSWTPPNLPPPTPIAETEPNNSPAAAQNITLGSLLTGVSNSSDPGTDLGDTRGVAQDWYRFTITETTIFSLELVEDAGKDFDLYLFEANDVTGDGVASSAGSCGAIERFDVSLAPGDYILAVAAFDNPGCPFSGNATYQVLLSGGTKLLRYNIFCGTGTVTPSAATYFGSTGPDSTSFPIGKSTPGAVYVVTAVIGASQSPASNSATLGECAGGPTITSAVLKLNGRGKLTIRGAGFTTGSTILLNGSALASNYKVKKQGALIKAKGPLANGADYSSVVTSGQPFTITIITAAGGCSTFTGTAP
jgi:hypothetical protein